MKTVCIMCPIGCELEVKEESGKIMVSGNKCNRGIAYGKEEYTNPKRIVTAVIKTKSGKFKSVKTAAAISKDKIFELLELIKNTVVEDSLNVGDIALNNALGLTDIVITRF